MKKNILITLLSLLCALCLLFGLSACTSNNNSLSGHKHDYQWVDNGDGTHKQHCLVSGCDVPNINIENHIYGTNEECEKCKAVKPNGEHTHNYSLKHDETTHWQECSVANCDRIIKDKVTHNTLGENGACSICGYTTALLTFNTLQLGENDIVYGKVSNDTQAFSFIKEITANNNTTYTVSTDLGGIQIIPTKTVTLNIGDNTFYIFAQNEYNAVLFIVTIRRRPIHTVTYNTNGGSPIRSQEVEEDSTINKQTPEKTGYTFTNWTVNGTPAIFPYAITQDTEFNAVFTANTDTPYKVEYYLQNLDDDDYTLSETQSLKGTTDTTATVEVNTINHFTFNPSKSTISGNINADGDSVLQVYYTRNTYALSGYTAGGSITNAGAYKYGTTIDTIATAYRGYDFDGWYIGETLLSQNQDYSCEIADNITAQFTIKSEMQNYIFTSNTSICRIYGVKDKTLTNAIIPEYITDISRSAFSGCTNLTGVYISNLSLWCYVSFDNYDANPLYYAHNLYLNNELVTDLTIPIGITVIKDYAFYGCSSLSSVIIPYQTTLYSVQSIGKYAFAGCDGLTNVTIASNVKSVGDYAFSGCSSLTSIVIPNSVMSIGHDAFSGCSNLTVCCKSQSKPNEWNDDWSHGIKNVVWGYET